MKYLSIILSLLFFLFTSCKEKEVTYKQFSANDKSYTVHIPSDFSLENSIGNFMAFVKSNSNSKSDFSTILIYETDNGLRKFEQSLTTNPKFEFSIYKHTENGIYAECIKGMWSSVQIGLLKTINCKQFIIEVSTQKSRSETEEIAEHIFNTMSEGIPSEVSQNKDKSDNNLLSYSNPYYSISYPKDWTIVNQPDEMSDVYIGKTDGSLGFTIVRFDTDATLAEIVSEARSNSELSGMAVKSSQSILINGIKCNKMVNEYEFQGILIKTIAYNFKRNNTFYSIKFGTQKKYVDDNLELIEKIVRTLTFKKL